MSGEFHLIKTYLRPLADTPAALCLQDDVAMLNDSLIVTTDTMVLGRHCFGFEPPSYIARKLLRVNLSDIAAKGAVPFGYTLNLAMALPDADTWLADFSRGLAAEQQEFGLCLLGGDTVASAHDTVLTLTMFARTAGAFPQRDQAQVGDAIYVSGTLGKAYAGYLVMKASDSFLDNPTTQGYLLPEPRLALGQALRPHLHAAMDISDGLFGDLPHILAASQVGAVIHGDLLPVAHPEKSAALQFGDDYELLCTAPPHADATLAAIASRCGVPLTKIGFITAEPGLRVLDSQGQERPELLTGHEHTL